MSSDKYKDRGISLRASAEYYRMLEKTRMVLKNKHGIKVGGHVKLTKLMSLAPPLYNNKQWIKQVKLWKG